jgi:hypothetical protein
MEGVEAVELSAVYEGYVCYKCAVTDYPCT